MKSRLRILLGAGLAAVAAVAIGAVPASAQVGTNVPPVVAGAKPVQVQRIKVHGASLVGNLEGEAVDREVLVVLPPSYASSPKRRYPVVYALHGYSIGADQWTKEIRVPQTVEGAFAKGAREMIIVLPDTKTAYAGSAYSSSPTAGNFEHFVAKDLVAYIDGHYRTVANRASRGLAGHSMGGYGTARIGMKHSDVFGALYLMSPGLNMGLFPGSNTPEARAAIAALKSPAEAEKLSIPIKAALALSAAWSPNPAKAPLYLDLPFGDDGAPRPEVAARWEANSPFGMVDQYVWALRRYRGIFMDVGDQDGLKDPSSKLHAILDSYRIPNGFEIYPGTHTSNVAFRFQDHVIPFFAKTLAFPAAR